MVIEFVGSHMHECAGREDAGARVAAGRERIAMLETLRREAISQDIAEEIAFQRIHTLGPRGTNCEAAAEYWFDRRGIDGASFLHATFETAAEAMLADEGSALLASIAYPELHELIVANLGRFELLDVFIMPTHSMVLASRDGRTPGTVSTHAAPRHLVPPVMARRQTTTNPHGLHHPWRGTALSPAGGGEARAAVTAKK
jgi:hypothetical protein